MKSILRKNKMLECDLSRVMGHKEVSQGAKLLYAFYFGLKSGSQLDNTDLIDNNVVVSNQMANKYKRELKEFKLLHENKDPVSNIRYMYLGSLTINALVFADDWKNVPIDNEDKPLFNL